MKALAVCLLALAACTPIKPQVSLAPGVSLRGYQSVIVGTVTDGTSFPFNFNITDSLKTQLADRLRRDGLTVVNDTLGTGPVLLMVSSLDVFKSGGLALQLPGGQGTSRCAFSSRLADARSGKRLGEIVSAEVADRDFGPTRTPYSLLETCVRMTADEIKRRVS